MTNRTWTAAALLATLAACDGSTPPPDLDDLELGLELVADGLTNPVFVTALDGDARLFVVERIGRIRIIKNGNVLAAPFLDISGRVDTFFERGLLGLTFDPDYRANGQFYVYYADRDGHVVLERFSSTPGSDVAGPSAGVVLRVPHSGINLHGGTIVFGPDRMLYLAIGDGGCCDDPENDAQNMGVLLGKMVRIDVRNVQTYRIPASNPFVAQEGARPEIWASGLRNPWRFSFDRVTSLLYIADVGERSIEEINVVPASAAGLNFGWRRMEGTACFNPSTNCDAGLSLTLPVHQYPRAEGCAVIGGDVYRGAAMPELAGHYLYGDHCGGWVRSFTMTGSGPTDHREWAGIDVPGLSSFGRDAAGEFYLIAGSRVWRIVRG